MPLASYGTTNNDTSTLHFQYLEVLIRTMDSPLNLQPRPPNSRGPQTIADFIRRVNAEPGGFRALNEEEVRRNVIAERNGLHHEDVEMVTDQEADDDSKKPDIIAARHNIIMSLGQAIQISSNFLDFISLLLSREIPTQAAVSISPWLRSQVPIGSIGATQLDAPTPLTQSRVADNKLITIGKRLVALNEAADTALAAANRLRQEINSETKYWQEVLTVSQKGWSTARLPQEPHDMGVKFGFSNAAPMFKNNSVAPLKRAEDGSVRLEYGRMGSKSERLQATLLHNGEVVGRSSLSRPLPDDAPLDDRVKEARNTIFAQELWHEINREGRTLHGHHVRLEQSAVTCALDPNRTISFELVGLDDQDHSRAPLPGDLDAETASITLHLLLSNAHRQNQLKRSERTAANAMRGPPPPYNLLLPIITYYRHEKTLEDCTTFLAAFCGALRSAGIQSSFSMTESINKGSPTASPSEALMKTLLHPSEVQFDLTITPASRVRILAKPTPVFGTRFSIYLLHPQSNHLTSSFPPNQTDSVYENIKELVRYLSNAGPRALTMYYYPLVQEMRNSGNKGNSGETPIPPASNTTTWIIHPDDLGLVDDDTETFGVRFAFASNYTRGDEVGDAAKEPELRVTGDYMEDGKRVQHEWKWTASGLAATQGGGSLDEIVKHILANGPSSSVLSA